MKALENFDKIVNSHGNSKSEWSNLINELRNEKYNCDIFLEKFIMKYNNTSNKNNKLLLFDILDYVIEQGNMNIWIPVSSKQFLNFILQILKTENDVEIHTALLELILKMGTDFENKKNELPNFSKIYKKFKLSGVIFPKRIEPNYYKYILNSSPVKKSHKEDNLNNYKFDEGEDGEEEGDEFEYIENIKKILDPNKFEHKYKRLILYLVDMHENIKKANIMINKRESYKIKDIVKTLKDGNKTIIGTIQSGRLKNEKLMDLTLGTTEDINQTISRADDMKTGIKPKKFSSYFIINQIIQVKNGMRKRAKSERRITKKNTNEDNNKPKVKINDVDDIFDFFSNGKTNEDNNNYNNNNNINNKNTDYSKPINLPDDLFGDNNNDQNNVNKLFSNQNDEMKNNINNFDLLKYNFDFTNHQNGIQNKTNIYNIPNANPQLNNNMNNNPQNQFDIYGPAPEINSNQLTNYIAPLDFNNMNNNNIINNNQSYPDFNSINQSNILNTENQMDYGNKDENYFNNNVNDNHQMTQEEIEREKRLKELDELF